MPNLTIGQSLDGIVGKLGEHKTKIDEATSLAQQAMTKAGSVTAAAATSTAIYNGVSYSGYEWANPVPPTAADWAYLASEGIQRVRLPYLPSKNADGSTLATMVQTALANGIKVVVLDDAESADLVAAGSLTLDTWQQRLLAVATAPGIKGNPAVEFDIMNEPHDFPGTAGTWSLVSTLYQFASTVEGWKAESGTIAQGTSTDSSVTTGVLRLTVPTGATSMRANDAAAQAAATLNGDHIRARLRCTNTAGGSVNAALQVQNASFGVGADSGNVDLSDGAWHYVAVDVTSLVAANAHKGISVQVNGPAGAVVEMDTVELGTMPGAQSGAKQWEQASQAAVSALRAAGVTNWLNVQSYFYGTLGQLSKYHPNGWWITDSLNKTRLSCHYYFAPGGTYTNADGSQMTWAQFVASLGSTTPTQAVDAEFTAGEKWINAQTSLNGVWIGEIGWPGGSYATGTDADNWNTLGAYALDRINRNGWTWTYWAVGAGYGLKYNLSAYTATDGSQPVSAQSTQAATLNARYTVASTAATALQIAQQALAKAGASTGSSGSSLAVTTDANQNVLIDTTASTTSVTTDSNGNVLIG